MTQRRLDQLLGKVGVLKRFFDAKTADLRGVISVGRHADHPHHLPAVFGDPEVVLILIEIRFANVVDVGAGDRGLHRRRA